MNWRSFSSVILFIVLITVLGLSNNIPAQGQSPAQESTQVQGVFLALHLEVSRFPRIQRLWPKLVDFMALADQYGADLGPILRLPEPASASH